VSFRWGKARPEANLSATPLTSAHGTARGIFFGCVPGFFLAQPVSALLHRAATPDALATGLRRAALARGRHRVAAGSQVLDLGIEWEHHGRRGALFRGTAGPDHGPHGDARGRRTCFYVGAGSSRSRACCRLTTTRWLATCARWTPWSRARIAWSCRPQRASSANLRPLTMAAFCSRPSPIPRPRPPGRLCFGCIASGWPMRERRFRSLPSWAGDPTRSCSTSVVSGEKWQLQLRRRAAARRDCVARGHPVERLRHRRRWVVLEESVSEANPLRTTVSRDLGQPFRPRPARSAALFRRGRWAGWATTTPSRF